MKPTLDLERKARSRSTEPLTILGIDEVGTGAWAGPVVVAAVAFEDDESKLPIAVRDSKKLTGIKRLDLLPDILRDAITFGIGIVTPEQIDDMGMSAARDKAMIEAFNDAKKGYTGPRCVAVVDGRNLKKLRDKLGGKYAMFVNKADRLSYSVAAASIVAKVTRDGIMAELAEKYKGYGFESNVGYGTKQHAVALDKLGPCYIHRFSTKPVRKVVQAIAEEEENTKIRQGTKEKGRESQEEPITS